MMKRILLLMLTMLLLFTAFSTLAGKKQCQKYRKKLDNVQALQRQANSLKRSNSLSRRESKARDTWWRCETGKLKAKTQQKTKQKKQRNGKQKHTYALARKSAPVKLRSNTAHNTQRKLVPFASQGAVVVRAPYQGEKLQAWLAFYRPQKFCAKPKTLAVFSRCVEDRRRQQSIFEKTTK
ncbi:hypothetical protein SAMN05216262_10469 [Colwellia chukchiensis]|uniref:Uncharacterized protein n=1 Tax=Colwellia chukchiensis TaxID=641665 RepID=A0A1H7L7U3_9GAMM|nr:hypothetical protein [Colwellia chukchiensis]SEK94900.1 hypothetical protein SAMN05216262_10469 [Colwellia chukchiensis]